jgi:hypothetical protein
LTWVSASFCMQKGRLFPACLPGETIQKKRTTGLPV